MDRELHEKQVEILMNLDIVAINDILHNGCNKCAFA